MDIIGISCQSLNIGCNEFYIFVFFFHSTYALKAFLPEEASAWYNAIRNKQVGLGKQLHFL